MKYSTEIIDDLIEMSDADGVWVMMKDMGLIDEANYIELKYFN